MFDLQLTVWEAQAIPGGFATVFTTGDVFQSILNNLSTALNLRGQLYETGNVTCFPSQQGDTLFLPQNGGFGVRKFRFPISTPVQLRSNDSFTLAVTADRALVATAANNLIFVRASLAASTAVSLNNLSGA